MEPEGSLAHSEEHAACSYPHPDQSSPSLPIPLLEDPFYYYLPIYAWVSQVVSFRQVSPPKPSMQLSYLPCVPNVPLPSLILLDFVKPGPYTGVLLRRRNWK